MENPELKQAMDAISTAFEAFKTKNDERLALIEKKGSSDVVLEDTVKRIEAEIQKKNDEFHSQYKKLEAEIKRKGLNADPEDGSESKYAAQFSKELGKPISVEGYVAYKKAFSGYIRKNSAGSSETELKSLLSGSDLDGGFAVTPDMSGNIVKLIYETSPMRQVANVVTIGTDALEGLYDLSDVSAGWVGETESPTETTTPKMGEWKIPVHDQYAEPRATQRLLDDAVFNVEGWVAEKIADRFARLENAAFFTGNGTKQPRGFLTYAAGNPSATAYGVIEQINSGASGAFAGSNPGDALINLVYSLKSTYRQNASFMMKRATLSEVRKLKDGDGNYLWQPDFQMKQGGTLIGFNIVEAEDMPSIAANSLGISFGDFKAGYQIVDRQGIRILRDAFTAKPYVKFYTTRRVGGAVVNFEAIKLMKFAA